jgi:predicted lipid-binding transport protein (Tim44 family)
MTEAFDIYTLLFLVLAVVIFLRLRSVLGRRTGNERPPMDPYSAPESKPKGAQEPAVALPQGRGSHGGSVPAAADVEARLKDYAPKGTPLAKGLTSIAKSDPGFEPDHFLAGSKTAYEMIVMAFADGDKRLLKSLLGTDVYDGFEAAIEEREKRSEMLETNFVGIDKADIIEAELKGNSAQVTVKFVSSLITATRDASGEVVDGDPKKVREVTDIWTFARDVTSRDPNWKLIATEAAN